MRYNQFKHFLFAAIISLTTFSCQKVIDIDVSNAATQVVIEGNVTNKTGPQYVKISQTVPFTNTNTYPAVSGALVTITDNKGNNFKLTEGATPGTYVSGGFAGRTGITYTLTAQLNGKIYTAASTMPGFVNFDQLTYRDNVFNNKTSKLMTAHYQDPAHIPNQYLFVMRVNGVQVKTIFNANDTFTDGGYIDLDLFQDDITIKSGDTVSVDMECIDETIFTYWFSLSQQQDNGSGGGTTPSNPPSNLSNNALGYFSAHTIQTQTLVIN